MDISQWFGAMAPAAMPTDMANRFAAAYNKALSDPKVGERLFNAGLEVVGGSPESMARRMKIETAIWAKAAKEAGLGKPNSAGVIHPHFYRSLHAKMTKNSKFEAGQPCVSRCPGLRAATVHRVGDVAH